MDTKEQALYRFWSSFGWPAFDEQGDYDNKTKEDLEIDDRYITYEVMTGDYTDPVILSASLFHRSSSWTEISEKAQEISDFLGVGGWRTKIAGGYLWITRINPFAQHMTDDNNADMRRIILTVSALFATVD